MTAHQTHGPRRRPWRLGSDAGRLIIAMLIVMALSACANRGTGKETQPVQAAAAPPAAMPIPEANGGGIQTADPAGLGEAVEEAVEMVSEQADAELPVEGPVPPEEVNAAEAPCRAESPDQDTWLDKTQRTVFWTVCGTARWFDGFFGDLQRFDARTQETAGRLGVGGFYDQRDKFDLDFKLRAQLALPALKNRTRLLLGRGTTEELIEDRGSGSTGDALPDRFNNVDDASWLLGLGYRRGTSLKRGFDFSVGAKLRAPPEPYVKGRWFRNWTVSDESLVRFRETVFWTDDRRFGQTTQLDYDYLIGESMLLRFANFGTIAEREIDGWELGSSLYLFQGLSNRRALTYLLFVRGQTKAEEELQNLGFELRYRQRILRKWLFIEYRSSVTWPKYFANEEREANFGAGIGFEMYFGPVPDEQLR